MSITVMAPAALPVAPSATAVKAIEAPIAVPAVETPVEKQEEKKQQLSPRFAQLARKERMLRAEQQKIHVEKEALKAKIAEYETSYLPKSKLSELARSNPLGALEQIGITPDEFTQALLNSNPQDAALQKLMQRIDAIENGQKQTLTTLEQQQKEAYDQAVNQIRNDVKVTAETDSRFETIKEADQKGWQATEGAVSLIETVFQEGWPEKKLPKGHIMNIEDALLHTQTWVLDRAYEMAQIKGVKEKFSPPPAPVAEVPKQIPAQQKPPAKTLTHSMNASNKRLSGQERRERAIAALTGQL